MHRRSAAHRGMRNLRLSTAAILALSVVGAACSSSGAPSSSPNATIKPTSPTTSTTPTPSSTTRSNISPSGGRLDTFRSCMASHGVSLPRRPRSNNTARPAGSQRVGPVRGGVRFLQPPAGVDRTTYESALNACRSLVLRGAGPNGSARGAAPGLSSSHVVDYKVTGDARRTEVVYVDSGGANDAQVSVPHQILVTLASGAPLSVIAQGMDGSTIGCEVLIDGKPLIDNAARTPSLAECNGTVP
jgi:hypothetical protein